MGGQRADSGQTSVLAENSRASSLDALQDNVYKSKVMQQLKSQLSEAMAEAEWNWLIPHAKRDAVVVVNENLDLVDVGVAIATDNVPTVQRWIQEAMIAKPSSEQLTDWNQNTDKRFQTLIVQPYVLVQES
jgi:hypothetical protein